MSEAERKVRRTEVIMETHSVTTIRTRTHWIDVVYCQICRQDVRSVSAEFACCEYGVPADEVRTAEICGGIHMVNDSGYCALSLAGHFGRDRRVEAEPVCRLEE